MRGRPPNAIPTERINLHLPVDIKAQVDVHLFSDVEQRIPKGAYATFIGDLIRDYFSRMKKPNE